VAPPPRVEVALAVASRGGRILVARRAEGAHLGGLWEVPGGKLEPGEDAAQAALRELREETGLSGGAAEPLVVVLYDYADQPVRLSTFLVREPAGEPVLPDGRKWAWLSLRELADLPMPPANATILRALTWRL
jgi:8-oxo-dGTP diphosphatase